MSDEYEPILAGGPLSQGDVFSWSEEHRKRPWKTFGVVVTADCDLHQKKAGTLSYVPAFTAKDYLWEFWKDKRLRPTLTSNLSKLRLRVGKILRAGNSSQAELSDEAIRYMVSQHRHDLPSAIGVTDPGQTNSLRNVLDKVIQLSKLLSLTEPNMDQFIACYELCSNKVGAENKRQLIKDFQGAIGSLPGDVFHITTTDGVEDGGLFLLLRHISQCELDAVATRPEELREGKAQARRIGRLAAPFRYAMTQNLGRVFSDIGLPDEYAERQAFSAAKLFDEGEE